MEFSQRGTFDRNPVAGIGTTNNTQAWRLQMASGFDPTRLVTGSMMFEPLLISAILDHAELYHGDTEIVSARTEGDIHRYTYADCALRSRKLAQALDRLLVMTGDRVGTFAWNGYRHMELYYGVSGSGRICHTINPRLFPDQLHYIVNHAEDQAVFFDITFLPLMKALKPGCPGVRHWVCIHWGSRPWTRSCPWCRCSMSTPGACPTRVR